MPTSPSDSFPSRNHMFRTRCKKCGQCNQVEVTMQDDHNELQECACANCGRPLGTVRGSIVPSVMVVIDQECDG